MSFFLRQFRSFIFGVFAAFSFQVANAAECVPSTTELGVLSPGRESCCPVLGIGFDGPAWVEKLPVLFSVIGLVIVTATLLVLAINRSKQRDDDV